MVCGEIVKLLLEGTYDLAMPETVAIYLEGKLNPGVGPQDVALALIGEVYPDGFVKNCILEFVGPGIASLTTDFRNGIDVMTAETACWTSIWQTDAETERFLKLHGRENAYRELRPAVVTWYDKCVRVDLSKVHAMIALPFHPSNVWEIRSFQENAEDLLRKVEQDAAERAGELGKSLKLVRKLEKGKLRVDQAIISGCAGGLYSNIMAAAHILEGGTWDSARLPFSIYPASQPIYMELIKNGTAARLMQLGAILKTAFCGPCIGAGDVPGNGELSIRHVTRNFLNREGANVKEGQIAAVALMDARSVAATVANGGLLSSAEDVAQEWNEPEYVYDPIIYQRQIQCFIGKNNRDEELIYGPNIKDWPEIEPMKENLLLQVCGKLLDEVTTTDDLCPSGETNSYRANPERLAGFTLAGRDPEYVGRTRITEKFRKDIAEKGRIPAELEAVWGLLRKLEIKRKPSGDLETPLSEIQIGSVLYAKRPGDGSSREMAVSNQRVLGGLANIAVEYGTKRYRTNLINWGMFPFQMEEEPEFEIGDWIYIPGVREIILHPERPIRAWIVGKKEISMYMLPITKLEKEILQAGGLINYNRKRRGLH
ncbi:MAG: hydratase [Clostridium sp.]